MLARRLLPFVASLFVCLAASATTVEQRSPFRQGHWWDPARSGHGFEVLSSGGQVFVVWYTYDDGGRPTWYTAQGAQETLGSIWPLQKHRWSDGRIVESTNVGNLRLAPNHFESLTASWQLGSTQGTWSIEPFVESGTINEVDLTGHWYNPARSGWGMTLLDQGDVFGAVIYAYDAAGAPTWMAGFDRGKGTHVDLRWTRGSCPGCTYQAVGSEPAGSIDISYRGDADATVRASLSVPIAAGIDIDGARITQLGRPASIRTADYQLVSFARAQTLKAFLAAGMENRVFMSAGADFSPAPAGSGAVSFSTTNVQENGVDEADVMKSDGRYVYALGPTTYGYLNGIYSNTRTVRTAFVDGGATLVPSGEFTLASATYGSGEAGLYLHGGNLVTLASGYYYGGWYYQPSMTAETHIEIRSLANPAAPASRWLAKLSGTLVSSRRVGDRLYVVTRFTPNVPGYVSYVSNEAARMANSAILAAAPLESMLPWISINGGASQPVVGPASVFAPQVGGNKPIADMVVVSVIDIPQARLMQSLAIVGRTEAMYVTPANLYLASSRYETRLLDPRLPRPQQGSLLNTDIHQIAIEPTGLRLVGSGSIEGWVGYGDKAAFRFGEHAGKLGVVSSHAGTWWGSNLNRVTLLQPSAITPGLLKTVSYLPNRSRPQALGKPNEILYGTRFVGDKLYAVTFRQIDPLYIVDLANASDPRISGELEIPGFSDYLHPLPNGLLLGFGRDTRAADGAGDGRWAWFQGLHLTLFDVSGSAPREIQRALIGKRGSDSALFQSHHALSALTRADGSTLIAFPASVNDGAPLWGYTGDSAYYPWQYSGLMRFEVRGTTPADAHLVAAQPLVTARSNGAATTYPPSGEGTWDQGRSVLFPDASIYIGSGKFWRQDAFGNTTGPY